MKTPTPLPPTLPALLLLALLPLAACSPDPAPPEAGLSVAEAMQGVADEGFASADRPRSFSFPADHGPHPDFRIEWWYVTGTLATSPAAGSGPGRRFGYQFTVFRNAVAPPADDPDAAPAPDVRPSAWATRQVYLAHFAVTDEAGERFASAERLARGAAGLAGARAAPFRVWVEDWELAAVEGSPPPPFAEDPAAAALLPVRLTASQESPFGLVELDLVLSPGKPPVLHGEAGLSQKGSGDDGSGELNASYYVSLTRMPTAGTVTLDGETFAVSGTSWMDREWSTSALTEDQVGWDWFSLKLGDAAEEARELMVFQLRRRDGTADPKTSGTVVFPLARGDRSREDGSGDDGSKEDGPTPRFSPSRSLPPGAFTLEPTGSWTSPRSGATYPSGWHLRVPSEGLDLTITPWIEDQELAVGFRYWEGAVDVSGTDDGAPVSGTGYVELTGYADEATFR